MNGFSRVCAVTVIVLAGACRSDRREGASFGILGVMPLSMLATVA